jgi:hypothetical protein
LFLIVFSYSFSLLLFSGQFLSLLEAKIVLSTLLSKYTFEIVDEARAGEKHPYMIPIINKHGFVVKIR